MGRSHRTRLSEWADLVGASLPDSLGEESEDATREAADVRRDGERGHPN
ncbi:hypothetical protein [Halopelagius longus]|uniref:Uncharacterized protein n=1 Tax=Halopelagius longus TaxID=1236180 RepID=A0A1H1EQC4_9EURY|nr:hypothetical protein [Halopelagius longus]SDQ90820.1 hypothetical protein SAMN05216278_3011 [Halopelagius longus]